MVKPKVYDYGYDVKDIEKQIYTPFRQEKEWGHFCRAVENERYGLSRVYLKKDLIFSLNPQDFAGKEVLIYVESGQISVKSNELAAQETLLFMSSQFSEPIEVLAKEDTFLYIFSGSPSGDDLRDGFMKKSKTFNFRNQDWADVLWTMVNREYAGKKIYFKKGNNSSFHFHCQKAETYFIHSGKLLLRLRAGKGEDRFFTLNPGQAVDIPPGLMHQAGGLEDTVVMEVSTRDYDNDAFLIESEFTKMPKPGDCQSFNIMNSPQNKYLKLFLETNDVGEVERALQKEILSGITTICATLADYYFSKVEKIAELCKRYNQELPVSIDILETEPERMTERAKEIISQLNYNNVNIKIPIGWEKTGVIRELGKNNINVECCLGMNEAQAILAANAGARYFSFSSSKIKDMGGDPLKIVRNTRQLLKGSQTEIILGGVPQRSMKDVVDAFLAGADIVSAPLDVLERMTSHPKTTENIIRFVNAFHQWGNH